MGRSGRSERRRRPESRLSRRTTPTRQPRHANFELTGAVGRRRPQSTQAAPIAPTITATSTVSRYVSSSKGPCSRLSSEGAAETLSRSSAEMPRSYSAASPAAIAAAEYLKHKQAHSGMPVRLTCFRRSAYSLGRSGLLSDFMRRATFQTIEYADCNGETQYTVRLLNAQGMNWNTTMHDLALQTGFISHLENNGVE